MNSRDETRGAALDAPGGRAAVRSLAPSVVVACATWLSLELVEMCAPSQPGESWCLRWLRTASDHSVRMSFAAWIVAYAVLGNGKSVPNEPDRDRV